MKYKGFEIVPVYSICSDWRITEDGKITPRKVTPKDIEYYEILDPLEGGKRWIAESTIKECKATIDAFLQKAKLTK